MGLTCFSSTALVFSAGGAVSTGSGDRSSAATGGVSAEPEVAGDATFIWNAIRELACAAASASNRPIVAVGFGVSKSGIRIASVAAPPISIVDASARPASRANPGSSSSSNPPSELAATGWVTRLAAGAMPRSAAECSSAVCTITPIRSRAVRSRASKALALSENSSKTPMTSSPRRSGITTTDRIPNASQLSRFTRPSVVASSQRRVCRVRTLSPDSPEFTCS